MRKSYTTKQISDSMIALCQRTGFLTKEKARRLFEQKFTLSEAVSLLELEIRSLLRDRECYKKRIKALEERVRVLESPKLIEVKPYSDRPANLRKEYLDWLKDKHKINPNIIVAPFPDTGE